MFKGFQFNQLIGDWAVINVSDMMGMFGSTFFNHNISNWCVWRIKSEPEYFSLGSPSLNKTSPYGERVRIKSVNKS